ncbi:MAG: magnesium transporter [Omnitrophica WOR_2 bacterium RIFCSPHIGHO2_02_FULL_52_10]|nr:MAG: magnesium transporter [Omnitrophica WOR_2 bacterium RIFCSPHIGHO2_02_FULL_52_10]
MMTPMTNSPAQGPLLNILTRYFEKDPLIAAQVLETMSVEEAAAVVKVMPNSMAVKLIGYVNDAYCALLLEQLPKNVFEKIANKVDSQKAANIFLRFSHERREEFLTLLDEKQKRQIQELLSYPEDSAGRAMSVDFIAFHSGVQVRDAVSRIRDIVKRGSVLSYVYVIDEQEHLVGILNMRDLLLAEGGSSLAQIMRTDLFAVNCFDGLEKVANLLQDRKYFAAPVVDNEKRMLGVVRAEQMIGNVQDALSEDIQKMFGVSGDERSFSPIGRSLRTRLPWLYVNLGTAFLAAAVVSMFEGIIAKITVLAVYLPVVAGQGGNAGAQSLAIVMRGLVMREIPASKAKSLILKETWIGIINGIVIGIVTGLIAWFWQGNPVLGVVIGLGMLVNLTVAGFSGAFIPLAMKSLGMDPAQCSSIILTTITDVMGFFAFLGFAVLFQNQLM